MPIIDKGKTVLYQPSINTLAVAPPGGTAGQVLAKIDGDDYNYEWVDLPEGPKVYRALFTQTGTDAPVATVLENTLGDEVVWSRSDVGVYRLEVTSAFTPNKTFTTTAIGGSGGGVDSIIIYDNGSYTFIDIVTKAQGVNVDLQWEDSASKIEILVYP